MPRVTYPRFLRSSESRTSTASRHNLAGFSYLVSSLHKGCGGL